MTLDRKSSFASMMLLIAILPGSLCSCLLLFQGTTEEIQVESEPSGATATLGNGETRVTPFSFTVPRNQDLQIHFSKPGYESSDIDDNSRVEPEIIVDVIPFMIPWAIDAGAGAGYAHQETAVIAHLQPAAGAEAAGVTKKAGSSQGKPTSNGDLSQ